MKERRGTVARLAGLAEGVAAASRRRQRERSPRVILYDAEGHSRLLDPGTTAFEPIVTAAERMVEAAAPGRSLGREGERRVPPPSTSGVSMPAIHVQPDREADERSNA